MQKNLRNEQIIKTTSIIAYIIVSVESRPLLDIGLPLGSPLLVLLPASSCSFTITRSLDHLVGDLATLSLPGRGHHARNFQPQQPSDLRATYPAYCHLSPPILRAMTLSFVRLRICSFLVQSRKETPTIDLDIPFCVSPIVSDHVYNISQHCNSTTH